MTNFRDGLLTDLFLASVSETNRCRALYFFLRERNFGNDDSEVQGTHGELKVPINLQQGLLGRKEAVFRGTCPVDPTCEAVPIISWITGGAVVGTVF